MENNCIENKNGSRLKEVFYNDLSNCNFEIPIYQRPYAWKPEEVETLLNDLKESKKESYFLGTLVVNSLDKERKKLEVIDGQQRLTTLYLISAVFRDKDKINLSYKIRESDKKFLEKLPEIIGELGDKILDKKRLTDEFYQKLKEKNINLNEISENILENLSYILKWKNENVNEVKRLGGFSKILEKVYFVLAYIPENTDVAKFFEVMNSRGKQLEHHQVLKAKFLNIISENDREIDYAKLWDFCSNMNYYLEDLIYYSLPNKNNQDESKKIKEIRKILIESVKIEDLNDLENKIRNYFKIESKDSNNQENTNKKELQRKKTLKEILEYKEKIKEESERKYLPETKEVNSIVKFSVFLLHTLRLFKLMEEELNKDDYKKILDELPKEISLDDKELLETFGTKKENGKEKRDKSKLFLDVIDDKEKKIKIAKEFILFLLKMRILFDYFIFKRSNILEKEDIKLRSLKKEGDGLELGDTDRASINLQLLFSFTSPNYFQQEWLTPTLNWLYKELNNNTELGNRFYENFIEFLEKMDKYLSLERLNDNSDLRKIFEEFTKKENYEHKNANLNEKDIKEKLEQKLNNGTSTEHYWFYKLDYLLWKNSNEIFKDLEKPFENFDYSKIKNNYRLTRKNSIEHIQPQSKVDEEWASEKKGEEINYNKIIEQNKCYIDYFGNLALISNHLNSSLLDKSFVEKRNIIANQLNRGTIESLKMLLVYSKYNKWTPEECKEHHSEMLKILEGNLKEEKP